VTSLQLVADASSSASRVRAGETFASTGASVTWDPPYVFTSFGESYRRTASRPARKAALNTRKLRRRKGAAGGGL